MCSRVLLFILLAMARNHGTMSYVFGPLAIFTAPQDASSPAPLVSTRQWSIGADVDAVTSTTPFTRRRPTTNRRRPNPGSSNIVFPSSDDALSPFAASKNHLQNPHDTRNNGIRNQDQGSDNTEQRLSPDITARPFRPKHAGQGSGGGIVFEGPSSARRGGGRRRVGPTGRPPAVAQAALTRDDVASDSRSPPTPCPCPTTSEFNPICVEVRGERVTMLNWSEFKCAQFCVGSEQDVTLLFHGTCQKVINKLNPFIHD